MNRTAFFICIGATVLFLARSVPAIDPKSGQGEPSVWMRKKLDYSKAILEGLAAGDFDQISTNAMTMSGLTTFEAFARGKSARYRVQLRIFQDANKEIIRQANQENIEGVALAFNQLTNSCVNCHKQLRNDSTKQDPTLFQDSRGKENAKSAPH